MNSFRFSFSCHQAGEYCPDFAHFSAASSAITPTWLAAALSNPSPFQLLDGQHETSDSIILAVAPGYFLTKMT
jgi:hypothetical protein